MKIAAVVYEGGGSHAIDSMLAAAAQELARQGLRVAGAIQVNEEHADRRCAKMALKELTSGRFFDISVCKLPSEPGCTLDPPALEDVAGLVASTLDRGADVMIINRFGKQEVAGDGFRSVIEAAVAGDIPVVVAVNDAHRESWNAFTGAEAATLTADLTSVVAWCRANTVSDHDRTGAERLQRRTADA